MKINSVLLLCILVITLTSCNIDDNNFGIASSYHPSASLLEQGIVNKYYCYFKKDGDQDTSVHTYYRTYKFKDNKLQVDSYSDVYTKEFSRTYQFIDDKYLLLKDTSIARFGGTIETSIQDSTVRDWSNQKASSKKTRVFNWGKRMFVNNQTSIKDTSFLGLDAMLFNGTMEATVEWDKDTTQKLFHTSTIFAKGLGLAYYGSKGTDSEYWEELVEQLKLNDFIDQGKEPKHPVAYIDTLQAMDSNLPFKICGEKIYNYYNDSKTNHYKDGKRAIWDIVKSKINSEKIHNESGYLTFRFIVNCEGVAGRFVTEQSDLDFQTKSFNDRTVSHFYDIIQKLRGWIPTTLSDGPVDAYFYLTFKLDKGELIEILPQ